MVQLLRVQRGLKGRTETVIYESRTRNFRNTRDIEVDEHFVADAKQNDLKVGNLAISKEFPIPKLFFIQILT